MIRYANISDSKAIQVLVNTYAKKGEMLQISLNDIYEKLYEFVVYIEDGKIIGVCALHPTWEDLAEIRSLAVDINYMQKSIGKKMVNYQLNRAKEIGFKQVFALTYQVEFFAKCGFDITDMNKLPKKIWTDCLKCPKFPECDETAVIIDL